MPLTRSQRQKATIEGNAVKLNRGDVEKEVEPVLVGSEEMSSDDASSSGSSVSDSDSESEEDAGSDSELEEEDLDALFKKSLVALRAKDQAVKAGNFAENEDEIRLSDSIDRKNNSKSSGRTEPSKHSKKDSRTGIQSKQIDSAFQRLERGDELGHNRPKSYRQKQRENREERLKSTGSKWFDMPAFAGAKSGKKKEENDPYSLINPKGKDGDGRGRSAEEMRIEVQAIRLRNAIDPKRFYRGSVKGEMEMPKYAQLGKIISGNTDAASTMTRDQRGKSVIDELVKDAENSAYAKRKFNEQQAKTNVGWSSHVRRHQRKKGGVGGTKRQRR